LPPDSLLQPGLQRSAVTGLGATVILTGDVPPEVGPVGESLLPLHAVDTASTAAIETMRNHFPTGASCQPDHEM
jgi:hypothetical protein